MNSISKILEFDSKNLLRLMDALSISSLDARLIGGCVRDKLLGLPSHDIDIATPLKPEEVISLLTKHRIKTIPTGLKFGTITALVGGETFEITSLRKDIECDGRHAIVEFTDDYALDAARRDFTINAMSYSLSEHKIYDYYDGLSDLKKEKVRFIGVAQERINEDYLRILRFFRFSADYSNEIDEEGLKACLVLKFKLADLPRERINIEMDKLLSAKNAEFVLKAMIDGEINVMDGLKLNPISKNDLELNLSSLYAIFLIENNISILKKNLPLLRFSKKRISKIIDLIEFVQKPASINDLLELWVDGEDAVQYLLIAKYFKIIEEKDAQLLKIRFNSHPPKFPLSGNDLKDRLSDQELGAALAKLKKAWIKSDFKADRNQLIEGL